jgi:signal transduction histidine kinase/CheY-like chemotaxis protein/HPt (histidine-containing phosphotransfer) domain-containing protein
MTAEPAPSPAGPLADLRVWAAATLALLFVLATVATFTVLMARNRDMASGIRENALWGTYQLDRETRRLNAGLLEEPSEDRIHDIGLRYDIVFSRVGMLESSTFSDAFAEGTRFRNATHAIARAIDALAPDFDALAAIGDADDDDPVRVARLREAVAALLPLTGELLNSVNSRSSSLRVEERDAEVWLYWILAGCIAALALVVALIILLLARQLIDLRASRTQLQAVSRQLTLRADEATASSRTKSEFLATMSHEIRSPMSGLVGVIELLRDTELDAEQLRMARMVHGSALTLLAVLNDILDFSKIEAGALAIVPEPTRLPALVEDLVGPFAIEAGRKSVGIGLQISPDIPDCVQVDPLRLRQILGNLLSNAVKFTAHGTIAVAVDVVRHEGGDRMRFAVRDSGIGMSPQIIARLFEPFMQADGSTTRDFGGTGLGLCICQRLARMLDGAITVSSGAGQGSVFTLTLPLRPASFGAVPPEAATPHAQEPIAGALVLVVDDDPTMRWLSQRQLQQAGLVVDVAENGEVALEMLSAAPYRLLLTDCHMPRMDGVALTHAIRRSADPVLRAIPIIGLTADVTATQRQRCRDAGMSDVLTKPLSRERLLRTLSTHLPTALLAVPPAIPARSAEEEAGPDAVFDASLYHDLFEPNEHEGEEWLEEFLAVAAELTGELRRLAKAAPTAFDDVATVAHRLVGCSLSVGATRLGEQARALEQAAIAGDAALVETHLGLLEDAAAGATAAIRGFVRPPQAA